VPAFVPEHRVPAVPDADSEGALGEAEAVPDGEEPLRHPGEAPDSSSGALSAAYSTDTKLKVLRALMYLTVGADAHRVERDRVGDQCMDERCGCVSAGASIRHSDDHEREVVTDHLDAILPQAPVVLNVEDPVCERAPVDSVAPRDLDHDICHLASFVRQAQAARCRRR
jgi:hypothetical protein